MSSNADPIGSAIIDYLNQTNDSIITVESNLTEPDEIPVPYLFRSKDEMPEKELFALSKAEGRILDVGAGAGAHARVLQSENKLVVALDNSIKCCEAMTQQGIKQVVCEDFFTYTDNEKFDTLFLFMNGFGIAGTIDNLEPFLIKCKSLLKPNGKIIGESADIIYLFEEEDGSVNININGKYHGEMYYQMSYKNEQSGWFPWLYVSADILTDIAEKVGLKQVDFYAGMDSDYVICLQNQG